jgi:hypothetical protein
MTAAAVPPEPPAAAGPPQRPLPQRPLGAVLVVALGLCLAALAAWEWRARGQGLVAGDLGDSPAAWAEQRRRVSDDPGQVLIVGDSRILLGADLDHHAELTGVRPLQLALVGTSGLPVLEDLARHSAFRGLVIVGVSDLHYFGAPEDGAQAALAAYRQQTPAERIDHRLGRVLERGLAFLDEDERLPRLLQGLVTDARSGQGGGPGKFAVSIDGRQSWLWERIETDAALRRRIIRAWGSEQVPTLGDASIAATLERTRAAVQAIRARGGEVVFLRPPSAPVLRFGEERHLPRARGWEALLQTTAAIGVHFEDEPAMQGLKTPEYSHLSKACARVYTDAYLRALATRTSRVRLRADAPAALGPADC